MSELPLLTPGRCVLALIDQQAGLAFGVSSIDRDWVEQDRALAAVRSANRR